MVIHKSGHDVRAVQRQPHLQAESEAILAVHGEGGGVHQGVSDVEGIESEVVVRADTTLRFSRCAPEASKPMIMASPSQFRIPPKLSLLIAHNQRSLALRFLDRIIGSDYGLFRQDPSILEQRQAALHFKIDLLLEWKRTNEALAWLCLETDINPGNVLAQAMKEQLKKQLHLDDFHRGQLDSSHSGALPASKNPIQWEGVAGMRELKLVLEADVIMPFLEPDIYRRYRVPLPNGILFYGPPGCGKTFIARKLASMLKYNFIELKPADLASIYVHGTQGKIGDTFREAEAGGPTLLFFDEIDAFIPPRNRESSHHYSAEVNEFLAQMNECAERTDSGNRGD